MGQAEDGRRKHGQRLLGRQAYVELEQHVGQCGKVEFAEASVAVPFVGATTGAFVSQTRDGGIRFSSMARAVDCTSISRISSRVMSAGRRPVITGMPGSRTPNGRFPSFPATNCQQYESLF